jgi:hypothetical protein
MAFVALPGVGLWWPDLGQDMAINPSFQTGVIDATGEKFAFCGRYWNDAHASKSISRVGLRFGSVTKAGGSGLTVSLQDVTLTTGGPMQPDEVQDQTVAIANGDASFASNTWIRTGTLSATRSLAIGDLVAVVVEFDGSGRLGADSVQISALSSDRASPQRQASAVLKTASWAGLQAVPNLVLEADDGTFGTLEGAWPCSAFNNHAYNSGSTPDEYAMEFTVPVPVKVDGLWCSTALAGATTDFDLVLYEGTTALATVSVDGHNAGSTSSRGCWAPIAEQTLAVGTTYRVAVKPTTANNVTAYSVEVSDALHWALTPGGAGCTYTTRTDAGSWAAATSTRRFFAGVRISAVHDGSGGAASGAAWLVNGGLVR